MAVRGIQHLSSPQYLVYSDLMVVDGSIRADSISHCM